MAPVRLRFSMHTCIFLCIHLVGSYTMYPIDVKIMQGETEGKVLVVLGYKCHKHRVQGGTVCGVGGDELTSQE